MKLEDLKMISIKIDGYERIPTKYDYELFSLLYYDFKKIEYNKESHPDLQINNCEHQDRHIHNTLSITPINIIYSNKLIKLAKIKEFRKTIVPMFLDAKLKSKTGNLLKTRKTLSRYSTKFFEHIIHWIVCSCYIMLSKEYSRNISKKLTAAYTGLTLKTINSHINNENWGDSYDQSLEGSAVYNDTSHLVQNIESFRRISYSNFSELFHKWMELLYNEWLNENQLEDEEVKMFERIAFFKKCINNKIDKFDNKNNDDEFFKFIYDYHEKYGIALKNNRTTQQVKNSLKLIVNNDLSLSEDISNDQSKSSMDISFDSHSSQKLNQNNSDEENSHYLYKNTNKKQDIILSEIREENSENKSNLIIEDKLFIWAPFQPFLDYTQWITLIYYSLIYSNYNEEDALYITNFSFENFNSEILNSEMMTLWNKIDKIYDNETKEEDIKIRITKAIDIFVTNSFKEEYSWNSEINNLWNNHPFFTFDAVYTHIWLNNEDWDPLYLSKGYLKLEMKDSSNSIIEFSDKLFDRNIEDFDLSRHYTWWDSTLFHVQINNISKYFWMKWEFENSVKNLNRVWRFNKKIKPSKQLNIDFILKAIMFICKNQYFLLIKLGSNHGFKNWKERWYLYNPSIWAELSLFIDLNENDDMIALNECDFETNMAPWIILYSWNN